MGKSFLLQFFFLFLLIQGCKKDNFEFPYVPINLNLGLYSDLGQLGPGETLFKDGYGIRGLIIYRDTENRYYVFDRACTYEKDFSCQVNKNASISGIMECPCCKSQYLIFGESADPIKGPATYPLMRYNAFVDTDYLKISN